MPFLSGPKWLNWFIISLPQRHCPCWSSCDHNVALPFFFTWYLVSNQCEIFDTLFPVKYYEMNLLVWQIHRAAFVLPTFVRRELESYATGSTSTEKVSCSFKWFAFSLWLFAYSEFVSWKAFFDYNALSLSFVVHSWFNSVVTQSFPSMIIAITRLWLSSKMATLDFFFWIEMFRHHNELYCCLITTMIGQIHSANSAQ